MDDFLNPRTLATVQANSLIVNASESARIRAAQNLPETIIRRPRRRTKTTQPAPSCVICDGGTNLQQPCPVCSAHYCIKCLTGMFEAAVKDKSLVPARCCGLVQIHTVLPGLDTDVANAYRAAFEEWVTLKRLYCPEPRCSAFIPERLIPSTHAGDQTGDDDTLLSPDCFPCPTCKSAICADCHRLDHVGAVCDTKQESEERAMLALYGYKQCPRCGEAIKKMFGCPQIECRCGANWCWVCRKPIDTCDGGCDPYDDDGRSDEGDEQSGEHDSVISDADEDINEQPSIGQPNGAHQKSQMDWEEQIAAETAESLVKSREAQQSVASLVNDPPPQPFTNLDAPHATDWEGSGLDFGEHPLEPDGRAQVWSCRHESFEKFVPRDRTGIRYVECNRCFKACPGGKGAHLCDDCHLLVCEECKLRFENDEQKRRSGATKA